MNLTRKIKLKVIENDYHTEKSVYKYLKDGIISQNIAMNDCITSLYIAEKTNATKETKKELIKSYGRVPKSKLGSAYPNDLKLATEIGSQSSLTKKVKEDFGNQKRDVLNGKRSLSTYKSNNPLLIHNVFLIPKSLNKRNNGLYHSYNNETEFKKALFNDKDPKVYIAFGNHICFKLYFGNINKSLALRHEIDNVFDGNYKVCDSSIQLKKGDIILNLVMNIPEKEEKLDENICVGVDIGIAIPAYCALNTKSYVKKSIGNKDDFLRVRTQLQAQKRNLQSNLKISNGGHGRKKKMKPMDRFKEREKNFVRTYNHYVSKEVVLFALQNNAKYINIEDLSSFKDKQKNQFVLRNWSYYQLQEFIKYKAKMHGIVVRKINPRNTSKTCSVCGGFHEESRYSQSGFKCKYCGIEMNADFNAARNIAMSTKFVDWEYDEFE